MLSLEEQHLRLHRHRCWTQPVIPEDRYYFHHRTRPAKAEGVSRQAAKVFALYSPVKLDVRHGKVRTKGPPTILAEFRCSRTALQRHQGSVKRWPVPGFPPRAQPCSYPPIPSQCPASSGRTEWRAGHRFSGLEVVRK